MFPLLDSVLVNTFEEAEQALNFCKNEQLGNAGFIALDRLNTCEVPEFSPPAHCTRIFDLV